MFCLLYFDQQASQNWLLFQMSVARPGAPTTSGTVRTIAPAAATATTVVHRPVNATSTPARVVGVS